jgi:hypothetical protein
MDCPYYEKFLMEKVTLGTQNLTSTFIGPWEMNTLSICDELIASFILKIKTVCNQNRTLAINWSPS